MFAPFSSELLTGNRQKFSSFRVNVQFLPAGGPRIRKLKISRKLNFFMEKLNMFCSFPWKKSGKKKKNPAKMGQNVQFSQFFQFSFDVLDLSLR